MKTLVNLSGGVDSTFALYRQLQKSKEHVLVHHCHLVLPSGRQLYETVAAHDVVDWLRWKGLGHFSFIESGFDYKTLGFEIDDNTLIRWFSALLAGDEKYRSLETIVVSMNKDEYDLAAPEHRVEVAKKREALMLAVAGRSLRASYPILTLTKAEIIRQMPSDLFAMTWYCRKPRDGKPCHMCRTCRLVDQANRVMSRA